MFLRSGDAEQLRQLLIRQLAADYAQTAGVVRRTLADILLARGVVKVDPAAVRAGNDSLRTQNHAVLAVIQLRQHGGQLVLAKHANRFNAPRGKHLIGVMSVMMVMMTAAANAVLIIVMMMLMLIMLVMVMMMLVLMFILILVMIIVVMMVMMFMLILIFVMIVVVMMMVMVAALVLILILAMLSHDNRQHILRKVMVVLHRGEDGLAADFFPRRGDDTRLRVMLTQERNNRLQLS